MRIIIICKLVDVMKFSEMIALIYTSLSLTQTHLTIYIYLTAAVEYN